MRNNANIGMVWILAVLAIAMFPASAYAYIDPGSGSYIIQILIAGIMAGALSIKMFWNRIKAMFSSHFSKKTPNQDPNE